MPAGRTVIETRYEPRPEPAHPIHLKLARLDVDPGSPLADGTGLRFRGFHMEPLRRSSLRNPEVVLRNPVLSMAFLPNPKALAVERGARVAVAACRPQALPRSEKLSIAKRDRGGLMIRDRCCMTLLAKAYHTMSRVF